MAEPGTRVVLVQRGLLAHTGAALDVVVPTDIPPAAWRPGATSYLGRGDGHAFLALVLPEDLGRDRDLDGAPTDVDADLVAFAQRHDFEHLRVLGPRLGDRDAGLAATAIALSAWHSRHPRCSRCGELTEVRAAGWERHCQTEGITHFPRTDPAVIMAVTDVRERLLLAHASHWPERRFSCLAGYVEPGESLEEAVRREVAEETGIPVADVRYQGSQPWPFPASLMAAFTARVPRGDEDVVTPDGVEITEARFFARSELHAAITAGDVLLPSRVSIARALIEDWYGGPLPG